MRWVVQANNDGVNWMTLDDRSTANQAVTYNNSTYQAGYALGAPQLPTSTALSLAPGSTLDLNSVSQQVGSLSDYRPGLGGSIINRATGTTAVLTLSPTGGSTTFTGIIQGSGVRATLL